MKNLEFILNDILNKALCQKGRIQNPNSNKIADFVSKYTEIKQLNLHVVVQQSELLKSDGTLKYSFWIEKYFIKVEDNKYKAKGNHYGIVYYTERELRGKYARLYRK